jgi:hypothetical protein
MKLDNVDVAKLKLDDLPKFDKCPCELCDDGCFERAGNEHHPECRRRPPQRSQLSLAARCPLSHYKRTFLAAKSASGGPADHRRHPCLPPPDNEIPTSFKNAPMSGVTSQRDHYQPPPAGTTKQKSASPAKHVCSGVFFSFEYFNRISFFARRIIFSSHVQFQWKHKAIIKLNMSKSLVFH